jgi:hypothetical protein
MNEGDILVIEEVSLQKRPWINKEVERRREKDRFS